MIESSENFLVTPNISEFLTHLMSLVSFYTPWKHQKTKRFAGVFGGYRKKPWHEMDKSHYWSFTLLFAEVSEDIEMFNFGQNL